MDKNTRDLIYLSACAVNGTKAEGIEEMNIDGIYEIAEQHMLSSVISFALMNAGIMNDQVEIPESQALRKSVLLEAEKVELFKRFEEAGIWYLPLKGSVLKDYYPAPWMREMVDYDILYDASRMYDVKSIMEAQGFVVREFNTRSVHDVYFKKPLVLFEMHRALFGAFREQKLTLYFDAIKDKMIKDVGNQYGYHLSLEDFYIYMIAHEYKHFFRGGTGIRSLLDIYVFLKQSPDLDWEYIIGELYKLDIYDFEEKNRNLALELYTNGNVVDESMLEYMLSSGSYGNVEHFVANGMKKRNLNSFGYVWQRLFLPMEFVERAFPFFFKHKALLPILPIYRLFLARKQNSHAWKHELRVLMKYRDHLGGQEGQRTSKKGSEHGSADHAYRRGGR